MTSHFTRLIFTFLFLAILSFQTFSQTNQNNLSGRISDTNGAGLAAAKIVARNQATGEQFTVQTNGDGNFNLENLPSGNYRITVEAPGFSSVSREISISGNANQGLDISLPVGNISESVTVTATRTQVATTDTAVSVTVISREELEQKPVNTIGDVFRDQALPIAKEIEACTQQGEVRGVGDAHESQHPLTWLTERLPTRPSESRNRRSRARRGFGALRHGRARRNNQHYYQRCAPKQG